MQFYFVSLNHGKFITKAYHPRKLDYLKSGLGKNANFHVYVVFLNNGKHITKSYYPKNPWPPFGGVIAEVKR